MPSAREEIWKPGDGPGVPVITLEVDGARCRVAPQLGFNCLNWEVDTGRGWRELLWTSPDLDVNPVPTRSGIPILFPFPNRIRHGRFNWEGKAYQLPLNSHGKHAIHGFVCYRPWKAVEIVPASASDPVSRLFPHTVRAQFDSRDHVDLKGLWQSDYVCTASYWLSTYGAFQFRFTVENVGDANLPMGLGLHPYFRIHADTARLAFSAHPGEVKFQAWELDDLVPTGHLVPLMSDEQEFLEGKVLGEHHLDDVYLLGWPEEPDAVVLCALTDNDSGGMVVSKFRREYPTVVLFTPPHREAVCIEPYTCTTDAINLFSQGVREAGLKILKPGQVWKTMFEWKAMFPAVLR